MNTLRGLSSKVKFITATAIIAVLVLSFVVFFIFQTGYEQGIRDSIFQQESERQIAYAKSVANNIHSDLDSIAVRLQLLAESEPIESGQFNSPSADILIQKIRDQIKATVPIDSVGVIDKDGKVANNSEEKYRAAIGQDRSFREWFIQTKQTLSPVFSDGYHGILTGTMDIAITYPIINEQSHEFLGLVLVTLNMHDYLSNYANVDEPNSQYLNFFDKDRTFLSSPFGKYIGLNFSDPKIQQNIDPQATVYFERVFSGQLSEAVFKFNGVEGLRAGEPIVFNGKPAYFLSVVTPTSTIYSKIDSVISNQRIEFYLLQAGIAAAIGIALFFLVRWSGTVEKTVKERTAELENANDQLKKRTSELENANEQLKEHDRLQNEFINVAAHELRNPVQPILGVVEILGEYPENAIIENRSVEVKMEDLKILRRNASRLERLSSDILDASRIGSGSFRLNYESFDMNELADEAIKDLRMRIGNANVEMTYVGANRPIPVIADKLRIMQVITNLLSNSVRFTRPPDTITLAVQPEGENVKVVVTDTGDGISADIIPKLFTKFSSTTKAGSGTGLGLFIAKAIVEAHGGRIWGENNQQGKGATFGLVIPARPNVDYANVIGKRIANTSISSELMTLAKEAFEKSSNN